MKLAGLILLPIYTTQFTTDEFGVVVILEIVAQFLVGVISFNLPAALLRLGAEKQGLDRKRIYTTSLVSSLLVSLAFLALFVPFKSELSELLFETDKYAIYFPLIGLSVAFEILSLLPLNLIRIRKQPYRYVAFFALKLISLVGCTWYFVVIQNEGILGVLKSALIANGLLALAGILVEIKYCVPYFNFKISKQLFSFGAPLIFTTIAGLLLTMSDRIIIKIFGEFSEVGIYGLAYKLGSLSNLLVIGTFSLGFLPIAFSKYHETDFKQFFSRIFTYFIGLIAVLTLGISIFSKEIIKVISHDQPDYWLAIILVPIIAFGFIFKGFQAYFGFTYYLTKKTKHQAVITTTGVILNIVLNFILIPRFDIYGAIAATCLSYIFMSIHSYIIAQKQMKVKYEFSRILSVLLGCVIFIVIGILLNDLEIGWRLFWKALTFAAFLIFLYKIVGDRDERDALIKLISSMIKKKA